MILTNFSYKCDGWSITDLYLNDKINLIVGKNGVGKTRVLKEIKYFAGIISGKFFKNGRWKVIFKDSKDKFYEYILEIKDGIVIEERLWINDEEMLVRIEGSVKIYSELTNIMDVYFPPHTAISIQSNRDRKQFPFIEKIIEWSKDGLLNDYSGTDILFFDNATLLIDNAGAGLDYNNSINFSKSIIEQINKADNLQVIMATLNEQLMNKIDIKYWNILTKKGNKVKTMYYEKDKELFDDFTYTGLGNFEFLTLEYYKREISASENGQITIEKVGRD